MMITIGMDIFIVVILALLLLLFSKSLESKSYQISQLRGQKNAMAQAIDSRLALQNDEKEAQRYLPHLETLLITKDSLINFSRDLSLMAGQNNLGQTLSFGQEIPLEKDQPRKTFFAATLSGQDAGLNNLSSLLKVIENSSYLVKITGFDITMEGGGINANVGGQVFSF